MHPPLALAALQPRAISTLARVPRGVVRHGAVEHGEAAVGSLRNAATVPGVASVSSCTGTPILIGRAGGAKAAGAAVAAVARRVRRDYHVREREVSVVQDAAAVLRGVAIAALAVGRPRRSG